MGVIERASVTELVMGEVGDLLSEDQKLTVAARLDDLVNRTEAARQLGVSAPTVTNWVKLGKVRGVRYQAELFVNMQDARAERLKMAPNSRKGGRRRKAPPAP